MRKYTPLLFFIIGLSCFTTQPATQSKDTFTFDYQARQTASPGSVPITLALIKPHYAVGFQIRSNELFTNFRNAIGDDIEEILVAKGFSLKGPYQSADEMVYADRKAVDLCVEVEINPQFSAVSGSWQDHISFNSPTAHLYSYKGQASLIGKINISATEPLTGQKMLSRSVEIPPIENIEVQTSGKYDHPLQANEIYQDAAVYNAVGKSLMSEYRAIMEKISTHFSIEELLSLKAQINELKTKKGF